MCCHRFLLKHLRWSRQYKICPCSLLTFAISPGRHALAIHLRRVFYDGKYFCIAYFCQVIAGLCVIDAGLCGFALIFCHAWRTFCHVRLTFCHMRLTFCQVIANLCVIDADLCGFVLIFCHMRLNFCHACWNFCHIDWIFYESMPFWSVLRCAWCVLQDIRSSFYSRFCLILSAGSILVSCFIPLSSSFSTIVLKTSSCNLDYDHYDDKVIN